MKKTKKSLHLRTAKELKKLLELTPKAILLNEETDEKVIIEIPRGIFIISILLDALVSFEDFIEKAEEGDAFDIGYEFSQESFLELAKPYFKDVDYVEFYEPSKEERLFGISMIASLSISKPNE